MNTINKAEAIAKIVETRNSGHFFTAVFTKKDNSTRVMNCRLNVTKHLKGGQLSFDPNNYALINVWDTIAKGYRFINIRTLKGLQIDGTSYIVEQ